VTTRSALRRPPTRTCVACRTERDKRDLLRVVRAPDGAVRLDQTGRATGRGAYLCADPACWAKARQSRAIQRALAVPSSEALGLLLAAGPPSLSVGAPSPSPSAEASRGA
jgi:predicted RNA-binding protein YlxR (DUF448 family)